MPLKTPLKTPLRTPRFLAAGATAVLAFVALGLALPDNTPTPRLLNDPADRADPPARDPLVAMAPWKNFPVGADSRPMVVFDATTLPVGLRSNPALSILLHGRWVAPDPLPASAPRLGGYPILSAAEAIAALHRSVLTEFGGGQAPAGGSQLVRITDVRLSERTFDTDRGRLSLPAWTILFDRALGVPATVLAVHGDALYPSPVPTDAQGDVTISPDGLRLTYNFLGAAPGEGNCRAEYSAVFQETATAVAIGAVEHPNGHNRNGSCRLASYRRSVSVVLSTSLANRVVVTYAYGSPLPVRPDGTYRWYRPTTRTR